MVASAEKVATWESGTVEVPAREVLEHYLGGLEVFARRLGVSANEVEEVLQEAAVRVLREKKYRPNDKDGPNQSPRTWVRNHVRNVSRNFKRKQGRQQSVVTPSEEIDEHANEEQLTASQKFLRAQLWDRWHEVVRFVDPDLVDVYVLCHLEERSYAEAAEELNLNVNTVGKRLGKARQVLTPMIERMRAKLRTDFRVAPVA